YDMSAFTHGPLADVASIELLFWDGTTAGHDQAWFWGTWPFASGAPDGDAPLQGVLEVDLADYVGSEAFGVDIALFLFACPDPSALGCGVTEPVPGEMVDWIWIDDVRIVGR